MFLIIEGSECVMMDMKWFLVLIIFICYLVLLDKRENTPKKISASLETQQKADQYLKQEKFVGVETSNIIFEVTKKGVSLQKTE